MIVNSTVVVVIVVVIVVEAGASDSSTRSGSVVGAPSGGLSKRGLSISAASCLRLLLDVGGLLEEGVRWLCSLPSWVGDR